MKPNYLLATALLLSCLNVAYFAVELLVWFWAKADLDVDHKPTIFPFLCYLGAFLSNVIITVSLYLHL